MTAPIRVRLGELIETQLAHAGANTSAALRAYLLLGFASASVDMTPFRRDIQRSLAENLPPELLAALAALVGSRPTGVGQVSYTCRTATITTPPPDDIAPDDLDADPFADVGVDV